MSALALAAGLALGLGGRDRAARLLDELGRRGERAGPRLERATGAATEQARRSAGEVRRSAAPAAEAGFDGNWLPRSGEDRRRVSRPGMDRRSAGDGGR